MGSEEGEIARGTWLTVLIVVGSVAVVGVAIVLYSVLFSGTAELRGSTGQRENTIADPNYRIASYDAFFDKCNAVVADTARLRDAESDLASATNPTDRFYAQQNRDAARGVLRSDVSSYNADSQKADTRAHFQSSNLPYQIPPEGTDSCVSNG